MVEVIDFKAAREARLSKNAGDGAKPTNVIKLADRRADARAKTEAAVAKAAADTATSDSPVEDSGIVQIRRLTARAQLGVLIEGVVNRLGELRALDVDYEAFKAQFEKIRPAITAFHQYCPPSEAPYSPRLSDSMAMLDAEQAKAMNEMMAQLKQYNEHLEHAIKHVVEADKTTKALERLRNVVAPKKLRQRDWDDPDLTLCELIDYAANPHERIDSAIAGLKTVRAAVGEERWSDVYAVIGEAHRTRSLLSAVGTLMVGGVIEELKDDE